MKYAVGPRREIGIRTVFNILGPLTNPAGAQAQVLGVADSVLVEKMAVVLQSLGCDHVLVVHGEDGLDEITLADKTRVCELKDGRISNYTISPEDFGLPRASLESLKGGTAEENAEIVRRILKGDPGPQRDVVLLNAAAGLVAGDLSARLEQGLELASDAIDSGRALAKLEKLVELSRSLN
jgi:anthranilate phosphoribosyltransferase